MIIILLLVIVVSLAIGLAVVGRSVTDISISTKGEESSRAFSAAEAGLERALQVGLGITSFSVASPPSVPLPTLTNRSQVTNIDLRYAIPAAGQILEHPDLFGKESFAQFWLANPDDLVKAYTEGSFKLYFGKNIDYTGREDNKPAVEVHIISYVGGDYKSNRFFYDSNNSRANINGFNVCPSFNHTKNTSIGPNRSFYCEVNVSGYPTAYPIMVRVRMLYSNDSHPVAIAPASSTVSFPPQERILSSTGVSGSSQRTLKIHQRRSVMPFFFDYVLFSAGEVNKN